MLRRILMLFCWITVPLWSTGQLPNSGLLEIKDEADAGRITWTDAFEEGVKLQSFSALPEIRQAVQSNIEQRLVTLRRMYAGGDGRELLTAVTNYLIIQQQFVKNVMVPAESLQPSDQTGIESIRQQINNFSGKEKAFLIDINNALRNAPEPGTALQQEPDEEDGFTAEEQEKAAIEREQKKPRRKYKLPHERAEKKSRTSGEEDPEEE